MVGPGPDVQGSADSELDKRILRLEVNAAMGRIVNAEGDASEIMSAAETVVRFGDGLETAGRLKFESSRSSQNSSSQTGYTAEQGDVTIKTEDNQHEERTYGFKKERVGHYKIHKLRGGLLSFSHFWKADLSTCTDLLDRPTEYHINYDSETLRPNFVGTLEEVVIWSIHFLWWRIGIFEHHLAVLAGIPDEKIHYGYGIFKQTTTVG